MPARAILVPHLYDVNLPIQNQSDEERQQLLKQGLLQVLERLCGEAGLANHPEVKLALENATDYVEQYSYQDKMLTVKYNPDPVHHLIYQMGHTVWGQRRPRVVLWLAIEDNQQHRLVGVETDPALQNKVRQLAEEKGLPLVLPLMDLEDVAAVKVLDVEDQLPLKLRKTSERYGAQAILIGKFAKSQHLTGTMWKGQWRLLMDTDMPAWTCEGNSLEDIVTQGVTGTTHHLVSRFGGSQQKAVVQTNKPFFIGVQDIQSATDFNQVATYLQSLNEVLAVSVYQVLGNLAIFEVTIQGEKGRQALEQAINMDHHLIMASNEKAPEVDLVYRWVP